MTIFCSSFRSSLQSAFDGEGMPLEFTRRYIIVKKSSNAAKEKIAAIINNAKFIPFISDVKLNGNYIFTVLPYALPMFFETEGLKEKVWHPILKLKGTGEDTRSKWKEIGKSDYLYPVIQEVVRLSQPGTALDLGCGNGIATKYLLENGWSVDAVDFCTEALSELRTSAMKWISEGKLRIEETRVEHFNFLKKYDLIVCYGILPYTDPAEFPSLWKRVHNAVNGYLAGTLFQNYDVQDVGTKAAVGKLGAWFLNDISHLMALLKESNYTIRVCRTMTADDENCPEVEFLVQKS